MGLKVTVDTLDGINDAHKALYTERDGKFHLDVEGVEDTSGLKSALDKERKARGDLEKKVKRWEGLGKTDEEIQQLIADHDKAERDRAEKDGDHAKILKQHQDKWTKEKSDLEAELTAARASERSAIIGSSIMAALNKAKATEEGVDLLPDRLAARIKFETVNGTRVIKIMQADGDTPMAGNGKGGEATFDDLVKEAMGKWPSLFQGSGQSGSGKPHGSGGGNGGGKTMLRADFGKLSAAEKAKLMAEGKVTIID